MEKYTILFAFIFMIYNTFQITAQKILADFEDKTFGEFIVNKESYNFNLFEQLPNIYDNPDTNGINSSAMCFGAVNSKKSGLIKNFVVMKLKTPVTITTENNMFSFLIYRSLQPQKIRIGLNDHEKESEIYFDKTLKDAAWDRVIIDLSKHYLNRKLESVWIDFSFRLDSSINIKNEAAYYFDDFTLSSECIPIELVVINPSEIYQTIDDFGASDCWTADFIGKFWNNKEKEFIAEKLFSQEFDENGNPKGIGLSTWRFNLGGGTASQGDSSGIKNFVRRTECFLQEDGTYDWTKQSGQMYFAEKAKEYGCENLVLFSNSPPVYFTKNGKGCADSVVFYTNLLEDKYDDFAEFLVIVAEHFVHSGYHVTHISPVNEPQYDWTNGQEGSPWENSAMKKLAVELNNSINKRNLDIKIAFSEAGSWDKLYESSGRASNQIYEFFNSESPNYIGNLDYVDQLISGHSYWTFKTNSELKDIRSTVGNVANEYNLKIYQTEWSFLGAAPNEETGFSSGYKDASDMDFAIFLGKMIYCDIVFANASSWSFWTALSNEVYGHKTRFLLLKYTPSDGNGGYNPKASILNYGMIKDTPNLWALGNYSRFIRPGYNRIRIDGASEMNNLLGTAFKSPDSKQIITVFVNMHRSARKINLKFINLDGHILNVRKYITSESHSLFKDPQYNMKNIDDVMVLLPRSITTIVFDID